LAHFANPPRIARNPRKDATSGKRSQDDHRGFQVCENFDVDLDLAQRVQKNSLFQIPSKN
jgi:hypothetical protein